MSKLVILLTAGLVLWGAAAGARAASLPEIEAAYADFNDAAGAVSLIESGLRDSYEGRTRSEWLRLKQEARDQVLAGLKGLADQTLSPEDRRAVEIMRRSLADAEEDGSLAPVGKCEDAQRKDIDYAAMRVALYACFGSLSNSLDFEGQKVTRVGAFDLLTRMNEPERRKQLFMQFVPLWQAINGKSERDSPYRRLIVMAAADARTRGSAIDAAAKTVGARTPEVEKWLEQILETWRRASGKQQMEPWDYRYVGGATEREL
ncbi:MAG TPA: hypothetical protein VJ299_01185, partial [Steroidobacteraceae bacterium]|nr:hypothetical protein [Steroidobacteraceae bacterium]